MVERAQLAAHELLELHELIRSEVTCAKKLEASMMLVSDVDLKSFMERSLQTKRNVLKKYHDFYSGAKQQQ